MAGKKRPFSSTPQKTPVKKLKTGNNTTTADSGGRNRSCQSAAPDVAASTSQLPAAAAGASVGNRQMIMEATRRKSGERFTRPDAESPPVDRSTTQTETAEINPFAAQIETVARGISDAPDAASLTAYSPMQQDFCASGRLFTSQYRATHHLLSALSDAPAAMPLQGLRIPALQAIPLGAAGTMGRAVPPTFASQHALQNRRQLSELLPGLRNPAYVTNTASARFDPRTREQAARSANLNSESNAVINQSFSPANLLHGSVLHIPVASHPSSFELVPGRTIDLRLFSQTAPITVANRFPFLTHNRTNLDIAMRRAQLESLRMNPITFTRELSQHNQERTVTQASDGDGSNVDSKLSACNPSSQDQTSSNKNMRESSAGRNHQDKSPHKHDHPNVASSPHCHSISSSRDGDRKRRAVNFAYKIPKSIATDEDQNWLSEYLCFVRKDLLEVFEAGVDSHHYNMPIGRVGLRCRFCAHLPVKSREKRSYTFPSSLKNVYQSLGAMLSVHFSNCNEIPKDISKKFWVLKSETTQGGIKSREYWIESAKKQGFIDTSNGIFFQGKSINEAAPVEPHESQRMAVSSSAEQQTLADGLNRRVIGLSPICDYLYSLMTHCLRIEMDESDKPAISRKDWSPGLPGFGCRYCCAQDRIGMCRFFPTDRRALAQKIDKFYYHLQRCTLFPQEAKECLVDLRRKASLQDAKDGQRIIFDEIWLQLREG